MHPTSKLQILPVHKTNEDYVARLLIDTVDGSFEGTYKCEMIVRDMREEVGAATVLPATVSAIIYLEVRGEYIVRDNSKLFGKLISSWQ